MELLKFSALLNDREFVELSDLGLLKYCLWSDENHKEDIVKMLKECITNSQDSSYKDIYAGLQNSIKSALGQKPKSPCIAN